VTAPTAADRQGDKLAGWLSQYLFEHMCAEWDFRLGDGSHWELVADEDLAELGYTGDTSDLLVLKNVVTGECFEVDLEPFARPVPTREEFARRAEMAAASERIIASWRAEQAS